MKAGVSVILLESLAPRDIHDSGITRWIDHKPPAVTPAPSSPARRVGAAPGRAPCA